MKNIELQNFEGTADQMAEQIFKQIIGPMTQEIFNQDKDEARLFSFSILWLGMALYANQFEPNGAKKSIQFTVEQFMTTFDKFNKRPS